MTKKPEARQRRQAVSKKNLLWLVPLALAIIAISAVLALPGFVSSGYHRATIEALASSLTGRTVHINGKLSLALLPHPQFIAGDITITSPDHETITASSLTLDIAPIPLLHGQISARAITLQSPHIALPWPLPNGAAAIAPPPWLTTLHAQINNGQISLGAANFTDVSADIFTGGQGTFSISGNGELAGAPVTLSLGFGALSAVGSTKLSLDIQTNNAAKLQAHVTGTFDASSTLSGTASFSAATLSWLNSTLSQPLSGTASITADPQQILLSNLQIRQNHASLSGTATLSLPHPALSLLLTGKNLTLPLSILHAPAGSPMLPIHLTLDAANTTITAHPGLSTAHLQTNLDFSTAGTRISSLTASLPGAALSLSGAIDPTGNLQAQALFTTTALNSLISGLSTSVPAAWAQASLKFTLAGTADHLSFGQLSGNFGPARVTGTAILAASSSLSGQLHFDQLDLTPFITLLLNPPSAFASHGYSGDFEITADRASIGSVPLTHLLVDASLGGQLIVRRLSASAYGGIAAASFTLAGRPPTGNAAQTAQITSARAILALPSAAPIAALLPPAWRPPAALTKAPLALSLLAAGPADALATSASLTLGDISATASPMIDLINQTANGAFTLRHPDAIAAFKTFGLDAGLAWPGAGSIALRANMILSATRMGFSDFVLSMGDLTANGTLIYDTNHHLNGQIDADTLALPPFPAVFTPLWAYLTNIQGKIGITANSVLVAGNPILGPAAGGITLSPGKFDFALNQAQLANGTIKGNFSAILPAPVPPVPGKPATPAAPPNITGKFELTNADAAALNLAFAFPLKLPSGTINAAIDLTASGYTPSVWLATLSGNASLAANAGTLTGFNLPGLVTALHAPKGRASQLRAASLTGATPFDHLNLTSSLNSGIATLTSASLQSQSGSATAAGNIDLPDRGVTLTLTLQPNVPVPPKLTLTLTLDGSWPAARKIAAIKPALSWRPLPAKH
jgi:uncharacterized protein involved in outer membrane biogenesis